MKFLHLILLVWPLMMPSGTLLAKYSGIPVRIEEPHKEAPSKEPPQIIQVPSCPMSPTLIKSLISAERIDEPLGDRELDRLNQIALLFKKMAEASQNDADDLIDIIYQSRLKLVTKINLGAAIFIGKGATERALTQSDLNLMKKIAENAHLLTSDLYYKLDRAFKFLLQNSSRSLSEDLRDVRRSLDDNWNKKGFDRDRSMKRRDHKFE